MKKSIFILGITAVFALASCDSKPAENIEEATEETIESAEDNMEATEEELEEAAMNSDKFSDNPEGFYGEIIDPNGGKMIDEFATMMEGKDSLRVKIQAVATDVCKNKGCWMKVQNADGSMMRIKFKDYGFFVPMDIDGKEVVFQGVAFKDTTSVEDLRHYAEDGGKSPEEIAAITEPEISTSFLADGVYVR